MHKEIKHMNIGGVDYDADRITNEDGSGVGYIELRVPGGSEPLAPIHYHGADRPMDITTYGAPLPLPAIEWLIDRGNYALAYEALHGL